MGLGDRDEGTQVSWSVKWRLLSNACWWMQQAGDSPLKMGPKVETSGSTSNIFSFLFRLIIGSLAGFYYFVLPVYMWLKNLVWPKNARGF